MTDQWIFKSETYDNCNCEVNCGCQFNLPSTHGFCETAYIGQVVEGHFNGTPLAGLKWAGLWKWPGEIADGNGVRQIVVDESADQDQRNALEKIISGEVGAPMSNLFTVFGAMCSDSFQTLYLPIHLEANKDERTAHVEIPGVLESRGRPIVNDFNDEPFHIAIARPTGSFEFTYAEVGRGNTSVTSEMDMAYSDSWAHWCTHHFDQDGLVRK